MAYTSHLILLGHSSQAFDILEVYVNHVRKQLP
jgi:hypothetical protein